MQKGSSQYAKLTDRIIELRRSGKSCKKVAAELKIPVYVVYTTMYKAGLGHTIRAAGRDLSGTESRTPLRRALDRFGSVYLEEGCNGGYIATVGEKATGTEEDTPVKAILAALYVADRRKTA